MQITPQQALALLAEGNRRFSSDTALHEHSSPQRLRDVAGGQEPFATIITCSDSRVPPEIIFDCGIGELFVIRNAGNVLDETSFASVLYAVTHLTTPLIVVLGHQSCGAVTAACTADSAESTEPESIQSLIHTIRTNATIDVTDSFQGNSDRIQQAIHKNAQAVVAQLSESKEIAVRSGNGTLLIIPAFLSFEDGSVTFHTYISQTLTQERTCWNRIKNLHNSLL